MNNWKVILATMVIFGAGVVTGGLLVRHSQGARPWRAQRAVTPPRPTQLPAALPGALRLDFLRRVERDLQLTPAQRDQVDTLLKEAQERTRKLGREEVQRAREEFRRLLTPEQRRQFDELWKQQRPQGEPRRQPQPFAATNSAL